MVFEVLTGKKPFDAEAVMKIFFMHMNEPVPSMSSVVPGLPKQLDAPVQAMMAKSARDRPQSLVDAVRLLASAAVEAGYSVPSRYTLGVSSQSGEQAGVSSGGSKQRVVVTPVDNSPISQADMMADTLIATEEAGLQSKIDQGGGGKQKAILIAGGALIVFVAFAVVGVKWFGNGRSAAASSSGAAAAVPAVLFPLRR